MGVTCRRAAAGRRGGRGRGFPPFGGRHCPTIGLRGRGAPLGASPWTCGALQALLGQHRLKRWLSLHGFSQAVTASGAGQVRRPFAENPAGQANRAATSAGCQSQLPRSDRRGWLPLTARQSGYRPGRNKSTVHLRHPAPPSALRFNPSLERRLTCICQAEKASGAHPRESHRDRASHTGNADGSA